MVEYGDDRNKLEEGWKMKGDSGGRKEDEGVRGRVEDERR
jgi:hypothetical protein